MPTESYPTGSTYQPEDSGEPVHEQGSDGLVNYSEQKEYLGRNAISVAIDVFGKDLSQPGMFFAEAGSDYDIPFRVECRGDGRIVTFNLDRSELDGGFFSGHQGLDGYVISLTKAQRLASR